MHILFVIDTWALIGGTERHAAVTVPALQERGHRVTILCREDKHPDICRVDVVEAPEMVFGPSLSDEEARTFRARLDALAPDVIFHSACHNQAAAEILTESAPLVRFVHDHVLFCPGLNKLISHAEPCSSPMGLVCLKRYWFQDGCAHFQRACHGNGFEDPIRALDQKRREVEVAQRAKFVLTNSNHMRNELLQVGFHPEQTRVLYIFTQSNTDAQPTGPLSEEVEAFLARSEAPLIFVPARLVPEKGLSEFLRAMAACEHDCRAVISGTGPAIEEFRHVAWEGRIHERVLFSGWANSTQIEALYDRADIVVHPSVWDEPFGLVGIEAMAHKKPLVAFRTGGIPEWLSDGVNGFLAPRGDSRAMATAIDRLLEDAELRRSMGEEGNAILGERFTMQAHLDGLEEALVSAGRSGI